jgi:hypothetical protein
LPMPFTFLNENTASRRLSFNNGICWLVCVI